MTGGETLYVEVGGDGQGVSGGSNGGGNGATLAGDSSGGGGGASDVRTTSCGGPCPGQAASLATRLLVAAGGGGGGVGYPPPSGAAGAGGAAGNSPQPGVDGTDDSNTAGGHGKGGGAGSSSQGGSGGAAGTGEHPAGAGTDGSSGSGRQRPARASAASRRTPVVVEAAAITAAVEAARAHSMAGTPVVAAAAVPAPASSIHRPPTRASEPTRPEYRWSRSATRPLLASCSPRWLPRSPISLLIGAGEARQADPGIRHENNTKKACKSFNGFASRVKGMVTVGKLSSSEAAELNQLAQAVQNTLGC